MIPNNESNKEKKWERKGKEERDREKENAK